MAEITNQNQWTAVDDYLAQMFAPPDVALDAALQNSDAAGLPPIGVAPMQGKLLQVFALLNRARFILEIGTLGGYSTIWLARALPDDGKLISLELNPKHAEVARTNVERAGLSDKVEIRVGVALETLSQLATENLPPFDLVFIDADKPNVANYFEWALKLTKRGSLIITDNVVRKGAVINHDSDDQNVQGVRRLNEVLAAEPRVTATVVQMVGSKGYDGMAVAVVTGE